MSTGTVAHAHRLLVEAIAVLDASRTLADDPALLSVLTVAEGVSRRLTVVAVETVAELQRRGTFVGKNYPSTTRAVSDLLGLDHVEARYRTTAADQVCARTGLDGTPLPPRLPATSRVFIEAQIGLRHVDVIAKVLATPAAGRLSPQVWAAVEAELADKAPLYTPRELRGYGTEMVEKLDQDGVEPDDKPRDDVNELFLFPNDGGKSGGRIVGRFDNPEMFEQIAALIDTKSGPLTGDDTRSAAQRRAAALADICGYVLHHADLPDCGGQRPHVNVLISLEDLENRARAAMLDFGSTLSPAALRMLACDAAIIPIVLGSNGQPVDVGRSTRVIPIAIRRAVAARDGGCARPGCTLPPSWCEVHHVIPWESGGETSVENCVMLCRVHHRDMHIAEWDVKIVDGVPEFYPPPWIDPQRTPRRKPPRISPD